MGLAEIAAAFKAIPMIVERLDQLVGAFKQFKDDQDQRELDEIKEQLNDLTAKLRTTEDRDELNAIVTRLNRL